MQRKEYSKRPAVGDASKLKVGVIASRFNEDVTDGMVNGALETLREWKVKDANVHVVRVYGSFEVPLASARLIQKYKLDAVVAIGCIIKGETKHDEYLAQATSDGLMRVMLDTGVPIGFGIITTNNLKQALDRSRGDANKGVEAARAVLELALIR